MCKCVADGGLDVVDGPSLPVRGASIKMDITVLIGAQDELLEHIDASLESLHLWFQRWETEQYGAVDEHVGISWSFHNDLNRLKLR
jgi:hypothetical protein